MQVKQVVNVLDLLEYFAATGRPASLREVSEHFAWPRSSTFNLLSTLSAGGFLFEPARRGYFFPTPRWLSLSQVIAAAQPTPEPILKLVQDLRDRTGETVFVGSASGGSVVVIEVCPSEQAVRYATEIGRLLPIHATASGQSLISQMSETQKSALLRKVVFEKYGPGTPMSVRAVEELVAAGLRRGWFSSASNYSQELGGISVPILVAGRTYALTVAGPLDRIQPHLGEIAGEVHAAVERSLGAGFIRSQLKGLASPPAAG